MTVSLACWSRCASSTVLETYSLSRAISSSLCGYEGATQFSSISTASTNTFCRRRPTCAAWGAAGGAEGVDDSEEDGGRSICSGSSVEEAAVAGAASRKHRTCQERADLTISSAHLEHPLLLFLCTSSLTFHAEECSQGCRRVE